MLDKVRKLLASFTKPRLTGLTLYVLFIKATWFSGRFAIHAIEAVVQAGRLMNAVATVNE